MRKNTLKILCLALVVCCIMSLAACSLAFGKYTLSEASMGGMKINVAALGMDPDDCYLEMTPFGTAKFYMDGDKLIVKKWTAHCIFCGGTDDLIEYKEKLICSACRKEIAAN